MNISLPSAVRSFCMISTVAFFAACDKDTGPVAMLTGTITPENQTEDEEISGDFLGYKAYGFDDQGTFVVYISSNENATCSDVAKFINTAGNSTDIFNVLTPQKCNMFIKVTDYNGSLSASDDPFSAAGSNIMCPMGDGEYQYENVGNGNGKDYVWTGREWHGIPSEFTWEFEGDSSVGYTLDISMTSFEGAFIKEELAKYGAQGQVQGLVDVEVCTDLATSGHF